MKTYKLPELTPEEKALPVSKYYTGYPLHYPNPLYSQLLDQGAMDPVDALETLDMGRTGKDTAIRSVRHNFDVRNYGFPEEKYQQLQDTGVAITSCWESFDCPGSHLVLSVTRPCPLGGVETCSREWIGFRAENGRIIRDYETPEFMLCEQYLRDIQIHNTVEQQHLATFLPDLYAEYKDLPKDSD